VSEVERERQHRVETTTRDLSPEDRAWLEERLKEYRDLLQYLHDR
jgi:hypothetical protein